MQTAQYQAHYQPTHKWQSQSIIGLISQVYGMQKLNVLVSALPPYP